MVVFDLTVVFVGGLKEDGATLINFLGRCAGAQPTVAAPPTPPGGGG